jgi:hypothetical protein
MAGLSGGHSAGIFADMSIDGPEIGTLVLIVDRGKNLPNRKAMGKQNCYCAARLGKEARKTETDKRGGQTPRWYVRARYTMRHLIYDSAQTDHACSAGIKNFVSPSMTRPITTTSRFRPSPKTSAPI